MTNNTEGIQFFEYEAASKVNDINYITNAVEGHTASCFVFGNWHNIILYFLCSVLMPY